MFYKFLLVFVAAPDRENIDCGIDRLDEWIIESKLWKKFLDAIGYVGNKTTNRPDVFCSILTLFFFCVGRQHLWSATLVFYGVDIVTADWEKCYAAARLTMIYQGGNNYLLSE